MVGPTPRTAQRHPQPRHLRRVFAALDPALFAEAFTLWTQSLRQNLAGEIVALDGKTLRRSGGGAAQSPVHLVSAWAVGNRLVLGQLRTAEKSNEITAVPELLRRLELAGCIVTLDAMAARKSIARGRRRLRACARSRPWSPARRDPELPGRRAGKSRHTCPPPAGIRPWTRPRTDRMRRYYLSSLPSEAPALARAIRGHWGIGNFQNWVLDVAIYEDQCRVRTKQKIAAWDNRHLLKLLAV